MTDHKQTHVKTAKTSKTTRQQMEEIDAFRDARDWRQFHTPKELAISISIEAGELLELFQWKKSAEVVPKNLPRVKEELADVMIYSYMLASTLGVDVDEMIASKMAQNRAKYPVEKAKGSRTKYTDL